MAGSVEARLAELGLSLPAVAAPAANYIPYTVFQNTVFVSGQIPFADGEIQFVGKLGRDLGVEEGQQSARLCALNVLAIAKAAAGGDLDRVRLLKLGGFVNATADFTDQPKVINGASDLMVQVLGEERGRHARFAIGVGSLPLGVATEVDAFFALD